jgi:glycosyltransferase involved in cell wall biosynthesis
MLGKRLSVCYAAPGHSLLNISGPTRNVLSLAEALSEWADVTVAFHSLREPINARKYKVITIESLAEHPSRHKDDESIKGLNPFAYLAYLRTLRSFARQHACSYDLILEKGWRLSGFLVTAFGRQGVPGVLIENDVRYWSEPIVNLRTASKYMLHGMAQFVAGFCSRRAPFVIAETEELKAMLVRHMGISADRLEVVGLGVDHALFHPQDQQSVRESLNINPAATILLYVGGMDKYHDLGPVIDALDQVRLPSVELHVVGEGEHRSQYEERARGARIPVRFHGRVPHSLVPQHIAAADVCIAPYRTSAFPDGRIPFSTLKLPEYMACGRPVVSIPTGHVRSLVEDQISGFLFPNDVSSWASFLRAFPSRAQLREMGRVAARAVEHLSWERTAARYLEICQRLIGAGRHTPADKAAVYPW